METTIQVIKEKRNASDYPNYIAVGGAFSVLGDRLRKYTEKEARPWLDLYSVKLDIVICRKSLGWKLVFHNQAFGSRRPVNLTLP